MAKTGEGKDSAPANRGGYPYYSLQRSLEVASAVNDAGGSRGEVQKSVLAHQLQADENSAAFLQAIGAAKCFGLIDGRGSYSLTEIGKAYFHPTTETEKKSALLKALQSPPVFSRLLARFDGGRLPALNLLSSVLHRENNIGDAWSGRIASLFLSALKDVGVIDPSGFLRFGATVKSLEQSNGLPIEADPVPPAPHFAPTTNEPQAVPPAASVKPTAAVVIDDPDLNSWSFRLGDGVVRVQTSHELTPALWKKLNAYVQVLKPSDEDDATTKNQERQDV